ncbi:carbohydrate ABC transporter permease [Clostridium chauvoei]|uniref:carbohydrate ABC transporter permease n=1 Tax=Clostridium chauvoei TaxID=46867 RepID=UPI001C852464|nr:sugar ABC transporter permease [Clostridium chauvoei]MBX7361196.1 sugar ABC transporter permease [Clostridium chauvoei]MBX7363921.1 sugar ABC transporter permease [Clostridium chauvoei]MBX7371361.1 sugar ABC transporter permease [Clostridium chauvoei]MBX7373888.1 sugar ABC transporter permease [Clostridium chauvoei]MBX7386440.1 sugar ABC transporter permease [Clostridium chauvoei]
MVTELANNKKPKFKVKKHSKLAKKEWLSAYLFLLPAAIFFLSFVILPIIGGIVISFFNYTPRSSEFIGLKNYVQIFNDPVFRKSLWNTLFLVIGNVPIVLVFSMFVAVTIYKRSSKVRSFFRSVFYLPAIASVVSITVVWGWIFHPNYGILNYVLSFFGIEAQSWLGNPSIAKWAILMVLVTLSVGQPIVLYMASLGNIPKDYLEAAEIDGASARQVFWNITWPLLKPTTLYIVIITTINSFQCFSIIQLLTAGGPNYATTTIMYQVYERSFTLGQYGLASSMGVVLAIIVMAISIIQYKYLGSDVEY